MNRPAERGFTLVEMLVVITIIGMLIGLVMTARLSTRPTSSSIDPAIRQASEVGRLFGRTRTTPLAGFPDMLNGLVTARRDGLS